MLAWLPNPTLEDVMEFEMPYAPTHKAKTRIRIVNAASALFKKYGFENVTIDQVMSAAGLTRGGFYAHFKNKEDLFVACVENGMSLLSSPVLAKLRKAEKQGKDWVTSFAELYLSKVHIENPDLGCALPTLSAEVSRSGDQARAAFSKLIEQASDGLARKLAKEDGYTGIEGDARVASISKTYVAEATSMLAMMVGAVVLSRAVDEETAGNILTATRESVPLFRGMRSEAASAS
ncbi:TetR/AcrR family transcriptional regulator [Thalassospira sp.]|uniref:TetR/AcrR family transcriptional regulator n=1 Tax=Thalassospira sp. TaxID=1912094 RepID=UPI0025DA13D5|nr:TetR/AcrR family transcriptional regulator [Thalassospira sp.]|tara:strand:+ start:7568 stop:8269 length:702 start_codon:yes stop_codon:yes gene_type:complete